MCIYLCIYPQTVPFGVRDLENPWTKKKDVRDIQKTEYTTNCDINLTGDFEKGVNNGISCTPVKASKIQRITMPSFGFRTKDEWQCFDSDQL